MTASRLRDPQVMDDLFVLRLARLWSTAGGVVIRLCEGRYGITRREWRVIAPLGQQHAPGLISSELAEHVRLDRARTSRAITSFVAKQLVRRQTGPADRRQARVSLTETGQSVYDSLMPQVREINRSLLSVLSAAEVEHLDDALTRLQDQSAVVAAETVLPKADRRRGARARLPLG